MIDLKKNILGVASEIGWNWARREMTFDARPDRR